MKHAGMGGTKSSMCVLCLMFDKQLCASATLVALFIDGHGAITNSYNVSKNLSLLLH